MFAQMEEHTKNLLTGNILLIICSVFYLIWWGVAFKPEYKAPIAVSTILFLITAVFGISSIVIMIRGIRSMSGSKELIPNLFVIIGGIIIYIVLFFLTSHFLERQITTELLLIIGWGMLAIGEINALYGSFEFNRKESVIFLIFIFVAVVISMFCYIIYYQLSPMKAYFDGMVPLILIGIVMAGISFKIY